MLPRIYNNTKCPLQVMPGRETEEFRLFHGDKNTADRDAPGDYFCSSGSCWRKCGVPTPFLREAPPQFHGQPPAPPRPLPPPRKPTPRCPMSPIHSHVVVFTQRIPHPPLLWSGSMTITVGRKARLLGFETALALCVASVGGEKENILIRIKHPN